MAVLASMAGSLRRRTAAALPRAWIALLVPFLICALPARAQIGATSEYQLKAVFLFNFAQFVEWPESAFASPDSPLVIGVIGQDPFGPVLDEILAGEKIGTHPLVAARYKRVEDAVSCHILFVSKSEDARLREIVTHLQGRPVLTVGDLENFAQRGGIIRFMPEKNRIRLKVNLDVARAAGLKLSSKLLRPAEIVTGPEGTP